MQRGLLEILTLGQEFLLKDRLVKLNHVVIIVLLLHDVYQCLGLDDGLCTLP